MNERPSVLRIQDANRNFSRVEACARESGSVVLTMYKKPNGMQHFLILLLEVSSRHLMKRSFIPQQRRRVPDSVSI